MNSPQEWNWQALDTLSVPGGELPEYLDWLVGNDAKKRARARKVLYCEVANQGDLYSAAAACVDVIVEHAKSGTVLSPEAVGVLESVLNARSPGLKVGVGGALVDVADYCRGRILEILPQILYRATGKDVDYFREVCHLIPQLADSSEEVVNFLVATLAEHDGQLRQFAADALEEAREVMVDGHMP
ncbi:hypothetical protein [Saccharothrix xinjiangensis]|uniref:HEAT repeat protein n=1 Tax=Saccharothrix xinjiangensis TaxID=204798 RepID=A0ABV9Y0G9_9PSEU